MKIAKKIGIVTLAITLLGLISCQLDGGESLNGASTGSISSDLSRGELPQAVSGVLSDMRVRLATQVDVQSILGREYYYFTNSDPRFEGDVVTGNLDNNTFYTTAPWGARYAAIKDINLALQGLENTTSDFSAEEIAATRGVLNTLKAHEFLMLSNNQAGNGIRLDVSDPDNLGPIVDYTSALTAIFNLLSEAATDLENGGSDFPFELGSGYTGFNTPSSFLKFNKALNARVEAYRGNYANVLTLLADSFIDMNGDLNLGAYHTFSLAGADLANPLFIALNQEANVRVAHQSFVADAEANDSRVDKVVLRDSPREASGLIGTHDVWIYQSNTQSVPIIRNEELILLYAEANMVSSPSDALMAINVIRNAAGLAAYTGGTSEMELTNEILMQRRYSLFGEGHRWVDMRRFNKLDELPNDRSTDNVPSAVPIPANENI
ncbi:RagB/SusD family nutrient uptake outer membrane protein [Tenacibaculum larymnensis]|uniref:RagB/SusD family nutrient uptake outer membrane protein n=1 Tax=Tenacibaculum larymnensis TaxID=2878201 RepID=A0A9X4INH7_9FLAO|nr:RagB/SusD family nutrient uptake outer membrane protein [Tenacibaculum larymnensis]MDE1205226.1 RagB/SusD family nutrient uptake outer membrane protein [Tenacibaculum larymnensis]